MRDSRGCRLLAAGLLFLISGVLHAENKKTVLVMETLNTKLGAGPDKTLISSVSETEIQGIFRANLSDGNILYVDEKVENVIHGKHYQFEGNGHLVDVVDREQAPKRLAAMYSLEEGAITFSPTSTKTHTLYVFTDVDCDFCQKFHREVPELNAAGIEVKYLAFPRAGLASRSYKKVVTAWCAKDPQETLAKLKSREEIPLDLCEHTPVGEQFKAGKMLGVSGTPTLITDTGEMIKGFRTAPDLIKLLGKS